MNKPSFAVSLTPAVWSVIEQGHNSLRFNTPIAYEVARKLSLNKCFLIERGGQYRAIAAAQDIQVCNEGLALDCAIFKLPIPFNAISRLGSCWQPNQIEIIGAWIQYRAAELNSEVNYYAQKLR